MDGKPRLAMVRNMSVNAKLYEVLGLARFEKGISTIFRETMKSRSFSKRAKNKILLNRSRQIDRKINEAVCLITFDGFVKRELANVDGDFDC